MVNDGLNDEAFTREELVFENDELILHVFAKGRDQLQSPCEALFKERLGEIAAVADQLSPQFFGHLWDRFAVIGVAGRELNRQQFTLVDDLWDWERGETTALARRLLSEEELQEFADNVTGEIRFLLDSFKSEELASAALYMMRRLSLRRNGGCPSSAGTWIS